jgi:hypothetical protein
MLVRKMVLMLVCWGRRRLSKDVGGLLRLRNRLGTGLRDSSSFSRTRLVEEKNPRSVDTAECRLLGSKLITDCVREGRSCRVEESKVENVIGETGEIVGSEALGCRLSTRIRNV